MNQKVRAHILVSGRVQGVYFRENTRKKAQELGVFGWVRNLKDGKVEALFEGDKEKVERMVDWARQGPSSAKVENIEIDWQDYKGEFENFQLRY